MFGDNTLVVVLFKDGQIRGGTDGVLFMGIKTRKGIEKRMNSKEFVNLQTNVDECLIMTSYEFFKTSYEDLHKIKPRIPINHLQYIYS